MNPSETDDDEPGSISFAAARERAAGDTRVRCAKCNKLIHMRDTRCEHCGVNFNGEAWQFSPSTKVRSRHSLRISYWLIVGVVAITIIYLIFARNW